MIGGNPVNYSLALLRGGNLEGTQEGLRTGGCTREDSLFAASSGFYAPLIAKT
jgi:hypothetical protein